MGVILLPLTDVPWATQGIARVTQVSGKFGNEKTVCQLHAGDYFGEEVIPATRNTIDTIAITEITLVRLVLNLSV